VQYVIATLRKEYYKIAHTFDYVKHKIEKKRQKVTTDHMAVVENENLHWNIPYPDHRYLSTSCLSSGWGLEPVASRMSRENMSENFHESIVFQTISQFVA